jgi:hypothetical protein
VPAAGGAWGNKKMRTSSFGLSFVVIASHRRLKKNAVEIYDAAIPELYGPAAVGTPCCAKEWRQ